MNNTTGPGIGPSTRSLSSTTADNDPHFSPKRDYETMDGIPPSPDEQPPRKKPRLRPSSTSSSALRISDLRSHLKYYDQMLSTYRSTRTALAVARRELKRHQEENRRLQDEQQQRLTEDQARENGSSQQGSLQATLVDNTTMAHIGDAEVSQDRRALLEAISQAHQREADLQREIDHLKNASNKESEQINSSLVQELSEATLRAEGEAKRLQNARAKLGQEFDEKHKRDAADYRQAIENNKERLQETLKGLRCELVAVKRENADFREQQNQAYERAYSDATQQYRAQIIEIEERLEALQPANEALTNRANELLEIIREADARRHREVDECQQKYFREAEQRARRHAEETQFLRNGLDFSRRQADELRSEGNELRTLLADARRRANESERRLNVMTADKSDVEKRLSAMAADKKVVEQRLDVITADKRAVEQRLNVLTADKAAVDQRLNAMTVYREALEQRLNIMAADKKAVEQRLNVMAADKKAVEQRLNITAADKKAVEQRLNDTVTVKRAIGQRLNDMTADKIAIEQRLNDMTADKKALEQRLTVTTADKRAFEQRLNAVAANKRSVEHQLFQCQERSDRLGEGNRKLKKRLKRSNKGYVKLQQRFDWQYNFIAAARSGIRELHDMAIEERQRQDRRDRGLPPSYGEHGLVQNQAPWARNAPANVEAAVNLTGVEEIVRRHFLDLLARAPAGARARTLDNPDELPSALLEQAMRSLANVSARLAEFSQQGDFMEVPAQANADAMTRRRLEHRRRVQVYFAFARLLLDCTWLIVAVLMIRRPINNLLNHTRILTQISIFHREVDLTLAKFLSEAINAHNLEADDDEDRCDSLPTIFAFYTPLRMAAQEMTTRAFPGQFQDHDVEDDDQGVDVPDDVEVPEDPDEATETLNQERTPEVPLAMNGRPPVRFFRESLRVLREAWQAQMVALSTAPGGQPRPDAVPEEDEDEDDDSDVDDENEDGEDEGDNTIFDVDYDQEMLHS